MISKLIAYFQSNRLDDDVNDDDNSVAAHRAEVKWQQKKGKIQIKIPNWSQVDDDDDATYLW